MVRAQRSSASAAAAEQVSTRQRIIAATVDSLREEGFAATSARSIARHGSFNQALIFYHFRSVPDLFVATIEGIAEERLGEYRVAVHGVESLASAIALARRQYAEDVRAGHVTVLAELIAGASSMPQLGPALVRCMDPWITFAEETIRQLLHGSPLERLLAPRDAATALVAIYLGIELLDHLDPKATVSQRMFRFAAGLAGLLETLIGKSPPVRATTARRPRRIEITTFREDSTS